MGIAAPVEVATLRGKLGLLVVLLTGQLMANMDSAIVNVAAPAVRSGLGASGAELELVVGTYILTYALLLTAGARIGDIRGYRAVYLAGVLVFGATSLICGLAPSPIVLIFARAAQGVGAAMMVPQILTGIQLSFTGQARVRALGLYAATLSAGAVLGQVAGGLILSIDLFGLTWRPAFLINVPIAIALLIAGRRLLPEREAGPYRQLDRAGMAVLAVAMLLLVLPLVFGREQGWPLWTWLCLGASVPVFVAFVLVELRVVGRNGYPFVNLAILTIGPVGWGLVAIAVSHTTYVAIMFTLPLHIQDGLGLGALWSGSIFAAWAATFGIAGVYWRKIPARAWHVASPLGYGLLAVSYVGIAVAVSLGQSDSVILVLLLGAGGLGLGLGFLPLVATFTNSVSRDLAADLSGVLTTVLQLFGVVGIATFGTAYLGLLAAPAPNPTIHAYTVITLSFAVAAAAATVAAVFSTRRPVRQEHTEVEEVSDR
jgi:MFS family permease